MTTTAPDPLVADYASAYELGVKPLGDVLFHEGATLGDQEDKTFRRPGFVDRKQDRFSILVRFMRRGQNKTSGKMYTRWDTLMRLSFTLKEGKLNVFLAGDLSGHTNFKRQVINITRSRSYIGERLEGVAATELEALYQRQNATTGGAFSEGTDFWAEVNRAAYPAWGETQSTLHHKVPLFIADEMRLPRLSDVFNTLTLPEEQELRDSLSQMPHSNLVHAIAFLFLTKALLPSPQRLQFVQQLGSTTRKGIFLESHPLQDLSRKSLAAARAVYRMLNEEQRLSLAGKRLPSAAVVNRIASGLSSLRKRLSTDEITAALRKSNGFGKSGWYALGHALQKIYDDSFHITDKEGVLTRLQGVLERACGATAYLRGETQIGGREERVRVALPVMFFNTKNTTWKAGILANGLPAQFQRSALGQLAAQTGLAENTFDLAQYAAFLEAAEKMASTTLAQYGISAEHTRAYLRVLGALSADARLRSQKGKIPRRWFAYMKNGATTEEALVFLLGNIKVEDATAFMGMPLEWTAAACGVPLSSNSTHFSAEAF